MMKAAEIRQAFLDFFARHEHKIVPSAPVVPQGDPTLMFTNAGMNQFKDVFLGTGTRPYTRCADTQKCIRVSGKHNDLEEVGVSPQHHTFFEMLGNWSFGDYFKQESIRWAYQFLVEEMKIDPSRLWATVFGGDEGLGLGPDEEAERLWPAETGIPAERVLRCGRKDNFWEMAATGPCGPCSEIHLDQGPEACDKGPDHACAVNGDCRRFVEIWNLVFIQFNHLPDGSLAELPARHVDTGMGLERLVTALQGKRSNYDNDLFTPILAAIREITGVDAGVSRSSDVAMRVVADHVRALSMAIADNAVPSNKDRGYVLRRILRRASRHGFQHLGQESPFIYRLVPTVAEIYGDVFPEVGQRAAHIGRVIESEEKAFLRTLERGVGLWSGVVDELAAAGKPRGPVGGDVAFNLYETYGFPKDLIRVMAAEGEIEVDWAGWDKSMARAREVSRGETEAGLDASELEGLPATEFVGYWERREGDLGTRAEGRLLKLIDNTYLVVDTTPFYAEAGGQVGDAGEFVADGFRFTVRDTFRMGDITVHEGDVEEADLSALPEKVTGVVDGARRRQIMANHTATHLLHWALKEVAGADANQKGSLVHPDYLRFDFTHDAALAPEQIERIERLVNDRIAADTAVEIAEDAYDAAVERGVTALFGEKYGDRVRVVAIGDYSAELCGGTHCRRTGEIGPFQIVSEKASSAGIRRIVAETREAAVERTLALRRAAQGAARLLGVPPEGIAERVEKLLAEMKQLRKGGGAAKVDVAGIRRRLLAEAPRAGDVSVVVARVSEIAGAKQLAELADALRGGDDAVVGLLASGAEKPGLVAFASKSIVDGGRFDAGKLIKQVGKGGGRKDFAKGAAADPATLDDKLAAARDEILGSLQ